MPLTEAQKRAKAKWRRENEAQLNISLYKTSDADVMERLDEIAATMTKKDYVLKLIRDDIARNQD